MTRDELEQSFLAGRSAVWHPYAPVPFPGPRTFWRRAEGAHVFDAEGRRFFDATSSWWCITHGHCHPRLVAALTRQAETLDQVMISPHGHGPALELADRLLEKLGPPMAKVFYSDDGSTAVEAALKMAIQYWQQRGEPKRTKFLSVAQAYHGDTLGAVSVSHVSQFHRWFEGLKIPCHRAMAPYCYRCELGLEYPSCQVACLASARAVLDREGDEIAALIVEPLVMGAGGMIVYPKEYLEQLVRAARERGILVVFDEVFTGFGRTGTFFAQDQLAVRPDIVCLSKGLTAGMLPLAVTVTTQALYDAFTGGPDRAFYHGHTFTGNPLGCAVALESLRIFDDERTMERIGRLEAILAEATPRFRSLPVVGDVRQTGVIWAVELVTDRTTRARPEPANGPGWKIATALWQHGYWLRPLHNVLYLIPPYCTAEEDLHGVLGMLYSELRNGTGF